MKEMVIYEQPMTEVIRVCLRLEQLFKQIERFLAAEDYWQTRACVASFVDVISILERPEFKTKLTKYYTHCYQGLQRYLQSQAVNQELLEQVIVDTHKHLEYLQTCQGRLHQKLLENDFLSAIRLKLAKTAGAQSFDLPRYHFWLKLSAERKQTLLNKWNEILSPLAAAIQWLLKLLRQGNDFNPINSDSGFYECAFSEGSEIQLIRIALPQNSELYPEMSVGRQRLSVHFYHFQGDKKPTPTKQSVEFELACCR